MQTQLSAQLKQVNKNKHELNQPQTDTIVAGQKIKDTHQKINKNINKPSSIYTNIDSKFIHTEKQQKKLKQAKIQDFKSTNKTKMKNTPQPKIVYNNSPTEIAKKQQKKIIQQSKTSKSEDSSLQQQKSKIISKIQYARKSDKSSSTNSQDSETDSSKQNNSAQKKNQNTRVVAKQIKNIDKNSKKIQMNQSSIIKKNKAKQKKQKGSDDESDYAPSLREASKNRKDKITTKQKKNSSQEQKIAPSKPQILPKKGILKNALPNQSQNKLKSKSKPQLLEQKIKKSTESNNQGQKNIQHSEQRSLRKKKPVSYKHMDGDLSDQEMGQKVPYRGRFKSNEITLHPIKSQKKSQQKHKPIKGKQVQQKMDIQEQKDTGKNNDQNSNGKQPLKPSVTLKQKNITDTIENTSPKKQSNIYNKSSHFPDKFTAVRSIQQFQMSHRENKTKNSLSLYSRVIVQSVMLRINPINVAALHLTQMPSQQIQEKIKLIYQSFQHVPCCPLWKEGHIRKKKIIEQDQLQSDQQQLANQEENQIPSKNKYYKPNSIVLQGEHQNHQQIADFSSKKKVRGGKKLQETKMEEPTTTRTANNKKNQIIQNLNIKKQYQNKEAEIKKNVSKQQDQEQILVKKSSKRLRQKKLK